MRLQPVSALLLAGLLGGALAAPALAQATSIDSVEILPAAPNALDDLQIRVSGISTCDVWVAGSELQASPRQLTVTLMEACNIDPPIPRPFSVVANAGYPHPGDYRLLIENEGAFTEAEFTVFKPAEVILETVGPAYTDDAPTVIEAIFRDAGAFAFEVVPQLDVDIVEVFFDRNPATPIGPLPSEFMARTARIDLGILPPGEYEVQVLDILLGAAVTRTITVHDAEGCVPSQTALCLGGVRFRVEVQWRDFEDGTGRGTPVPLQDRLDTGGFWFFDEDNLELTVKVLDGCGVNRHFWVFIASGSTVEYEIVVTDTETDEVRTYGNDLGQTPALIPDTAAFATCLP